MNIRLVNQHFLFRQFIHILNMTSCRIHRLCPTVMKETDVSICVLRMPAGSAGHLTRALSEKTADSAPNTPTCAFDGYTSFQNRCRHEHLKLTFPKPVHFFISLRVFGIDSFCAKCFLFSRLTTVLRTGIEGTNRKTGCCSSWCLKSHF